MLGSPHARLADADDLDALTALALDARAGEGSTTGAQTPGRVARMARSLLTDPGLVCLVVDANDGGLAGFALLRPLAPSAVYDLPRLFVEGLFVAPPHRRRGYGRALMRGAVEHAEVINAPDVTVLSLTTSRNIQRFCARLGFARAGNHRVLDTATLAERLGTAPADQSPLEKLITLRRRQRAVG
ncbi:MAG: GNAT family N-acetyltransferase [Micrococcales bacterium]|nr:GNAT family N-acetyltransferase [Micrococcales bacterium]